tara:strand:- start:1998 stop:2897 length:900 start_codon:yes stop_codon:yes gene_type:complete
MQILISGYKTTLSNILNNKQTFFLSVGTITISIFILGLFSLFFTNLNEFLSKLNRQVQLVVYLKDDIRKSQRKALVNIIKKSPNVDSYIEISRDMAWAEFQSKMSENLKPLLELDFNPLPASYRIKFQEVDNRWVYIRQLSEVLVTQKGVESIEYGEEWILRFEKIMVFTKLFLFAMGGLLCLGLTLIISNTIRLSISSRQDEIELMLLIGATPRFVKIPSLFEGMFQGFMGSILALFLVGGVHFYLQKEFHSTFETLSIQFKFIDEPFLIGLVGLSIFVGLTASYISTFQFLRLLNKK